jgi:hypothetical protein
MSLASIVFPVKLRHYLNIQTNELGLVEVTSIKGKYIFDDKGMKEMPFHERRLLLKTKYPEEKIYKLKERVPYLRQLVKYKSGTTFVDHKGKIFKYKKSSKLFKVKSHKINYKDRQGNWTLFYVNGLEIPFVVGEALKYNAKYASIMHTKWGPFLYDITSEPHEMYRRKI